MSACSPKCEYDAPMAIMATMVWYAMVYATTVS